MMRDNVFTTFKVWDNGNLSKKEVLNVAYDHFMDIQDTFELHNACVRQIDLLIDNKENVYLFEIRCNEVQ